MIKNFLRIILGIVICLFCTSCGINNENANNSSIQVNKSEHFTIIEKSGDLNNTYEIIYTNNAGVKYLIWKGHRSGSTTPLYNSDGTLQIYKEN